MELTFPLLGRPVLVVSASLASLDPVLWMKAGAALAFGSADDIAAWICWDAAVSHATNILLGVNV